MRRIVFTASLLICLAGGSAEARETFKIGVLTDVSGVFSDWSGPGSVVAAKLAIEDFRKTSPEFDVEIVVADHQNKPDVAVAIAKRWAFEGVDLFADLTNSAIALSVSDVARATNKAMIVNGSVANDLTGKACSPNTVDWETDAWALAHSTTKSIVDLGGDTWFFLTSDFAAGRALEKEVAEVVEASGAKIIGGVRPALGLSDFSSFILQAQSSKAKIIGLSMSGADLVTVVKQFAEFGGQVSSQKLAALVLRFNDVDALGLRSAQGLVFTNSYYWDLNAGTREFAARFAERTKGKMPSDVQAGVYAGVLHYLKAVREKPTHDGRAIVAEMKAIPTEDLLFGKGRIRADGRVLHDIYVFEVKRPAETKGPYDYYKKLSVVEATNAFRPMMKDCIFDAPQ